MSLDQLLFEVTNHYRGRGFPESSLIHLRWTLISSTPNKIDINLKTAYPGCEKRVDELLGQFRAPMPTSSDQEIATADAVFGFAFGYQMKQWTPGSCPTQQDEVIANRIPGANNAAIAEQARQLHERYGLDLYLQFEIADAIGKSASIACPSTRRDQGTFGVFKEFVNKAQELEKHLDKIVVLAHLHHFERCRLIVERNGLTPLKPPDLYAAYDPQEAQPRVMSSDEYIVNEFASMAGMVPAAEE